MTRLLLDRSGKVSTETAGEAVSEALCSCIFELSVASFQLIEFVFQLLDALSPLAFELCLALDEVV